MWVSEIPNIIAAGTTVKWRDSSATVPIDQNATSSDWTLKYYLRTNVVAGEGHTATATAYGTGFEVTIASSVTTNFSAGDWSWEAVISKGSEAYRLATGTLLIKQSLVYSGTPGQLDNRTQNEIDRDNIKIALRKFEDGAQEYSIGGRTFKRVHVDVLRTRLWELNAAVVREKKADMIKQGLGNPHQVFVRFGAS